ncbi:alpha/beta hydrolase [Phenylobacterium sp.]|uniref:alpha/beta hydrolase n=1 Tax=Phenylobacterium sp. TaxID=1871053 RepID=UPI001215E07C|nr:alpha/beta hydrolase [Phenylobacterium sp.]THD65031.1 MAG: alpha/beta fold hydrolase [Phenylobacterium sp.]
MRRVLIRMLLAVVLAVAAWIAAGAVIAAVAGPFKPAGTYVDIGGRRLRLVCAGPPAGPTPTVWFEPGAFGLAADFAAIQEKLTAKGLRSCAYDRAGMGWSDPGPHPRDAQTITEDLEKLIAASGERGPFILVGHSMAGLYVRMFAGRNPDKVAGLVLIEATTPEQIDSPGTEKFIGAFTTLSKVAAVSASVGATLPLYWPAGDRIGLPPQGSAEKRHAYVSGHHARTAAEEVENWGRSAHEAEAVAPYDPNWPVSVIVVDRGEGDNPADPRRAPERAAKFGTFEAVKGASHTTILGETYGDSAVRGVEFVLAHLPAPAATGR